MNAVISAGIGTALCWIMDYIGMKLCAALGVERYFNVMLLIVYIDAFMFICFLSVGARTLYRAYHALKNDSKRRKDSNKRIMIIGAGDMGNAVLFEMGLSNYKSGTPVEIVDDDVA